MTIFHRGALPTAQKAVVDAVSGSSEEGMVNLAVRLVNVDEQMPADVAELWKAQQNPELPLVVVQYPAVTRQDQVTGKGTLDAKFMQQLLDSPVRREICRRILKGDSIVWLILEGDDAKQNDETATMIKTECDKLETILKIPPVDPNDPRTDVNVKLEIAFSLLRMSRKDPAEKCLVEQLVNINPNFADSKKSVVFPIFGRGRALCGLTADEITADNVDDIAVFLTGACSCEVKAMNPGVDLLVAADWDGLLVEEAVKDPAMPPLVSLSQLAAEAQSPAKTVETPEPQPQPSTLRRNLIVLVGLGIVTVIAGAIFLGRKTGK